MKRGSSVRLTLAPKRRPGSGVGGMGRSCSAGASGVCFRVFGFAVTASSYDAAAPAAGAGSRDIFAAAYWMARTMLW
jgi:hypothetical protein